jgi:peptide chain release factor 1
MEDKISAIKKEYEEINNKLNEISLVNEMSRYQELAKKQAELREVYDLIQKKEKLESNLKENIELLQNESDLEFIKIIETEISQIKEALPQLEIDLQLALIPNDPNDSKPAVIEIRAGAGGDESALFAQEIFRMYTKYAEKRNYKIEMLSLSETEIGGIKEIVFMIKGENAYKFLKFESGVHRVQRVPKTESGGRIHTSTATVAVLPEAKEVDVNIHPNELRIDVFRASGCGGQSVNTTDSAVRITHLPTGITVTCQDEKSQLKNKDKAMANLRSKILASQIEEEQRKRGEQRKGQIGTGDRSEKIRTYNFPQDRVTDHRINLTLHNIDKIMDGEIDDIIDALLIEEKNEKLSLN